MSILIYPSPPWYIATTMVCRVLILLVHNNKTRLFNTSISPRRPLGPRKPLWRPQSPMVVVFSARHSCHSATQPFNCVNHHYADRWEGIFPCSHGKLGWDSLPIKSWRLFWEIREWEIPIPCQDRDGIFPSLPWLGKGLFRDIKIVVGNFTCSCLLKGFPSHGSPGIKREENFHTSGNGNIPSRKSWYGTGELWDFPIYCY